MWERMSSLVYVSYKIRARYCSAPFSAYLLSHSPKGDGDTVSQLRTWRGILVSVWLGTVLTYVSYSEDQTWKTPSDKPRLRVSVGVIRRTIDNVSFRTGAHSDSSIIDNRARNRGAPIGQEGRIDNRVYEDGFVGIDSFTSFDEHTQVWGVENGSQLIDEDASSVDGDPRVLEFNANGTKDSSFIREVTQDGDSWDSGDESDVGGQLDLHYHLKERNKINLLLHVGLSKVSFDTKHRSSSFRETQQWSTFDQSVTDTYVLESDLYAESALGPPASATYPFTASEGSGAPLLPNVPSDRDETLSNPRERRFEAANQVSEALELDLTTISLGLTTELSLQRFFLSASAGPSLNFINTDARRRELLNGSFDGGPVLPIQEWQDTSQEDHLRWGIYLQAQAGVQVSERLRFDLFGRYDWLDDVSGSVGPSTYRADLHGGSFGGSLSWFLNSGSPRVSWASTLKRLRGEIFLDLQRRDEDPRDGIENEFTEQGFLRYTVRLGYAIEDLHGLLPYNMLPADLTFYLVSVGVHSTGDPFSFINNTSPLGVGAWIRPLQPFVKPGPINNLYRTIKFFGEYSPDAYYYREDNEATLPEDGGVAAFGPGGDIFRFGLSWYGDTTLFRHPWISLSLVQDVFAQQEWSEQGPSKILRWSSRPGIALDVFKYPRLHLYGRGNGAYGYDSKEPFSNNYEWGGGVAIQPFYGLPPSKVNRVLKALRFYAESVDVDIMSRHNGLFLDGQPESYERYGVELWLGR